MVRWFISQIDSQSLVGGFVEQGDASRRDMLLSHDWATIVDPHLFERRQTISHMSQSDFTYIVRRFPICRQTISSCFPLTVDISLLAEVNNFVLLPLKHVIFEQSRKYRWIEQLLTDIWRLKHGTYWYMKVYGVENTKTSVTSSILVIQVWNSGYTKYHFLDFSTYTVEKRNYEGDKIEEKNVENFGRI